MVLGLERSIINMDVYLDLDQSVHANKHIRGDNWGDSTQNRAVTR